MNKKHSRSQEASSSRAASSFKGGFGAFGSPSPASPLSYYNEPPDLSSISDSNVVVDFKNLLKKDGTTKAKALDSLRAYAKAHPYEKDGGVEKPVLEAWVALYPRVAIDNNRRVRELAHALQYDLANSARKGMSKYTPSIVGTWLAGTYDRDLPVSKVANDGIASFLVSETKAQMLWRRCHKQIFDFAQSGIEESPATLSDERTVSADDAQAKFDRVVSGGLSLIVNLLIKLPAEDIEKHKEDYENFLVGNERLWNFIVAPDSSVRRTVAQLLVMCLEKQPQLIKQDLVTVGHAFLNKGLRSLQSGSMLAYLLALEKLTVTYPTVWTTSYKGKESASYCLTQCVRCGSMGAPAEYWIVLNSLITSLPPGILPNNLDGAVKFLGALNEGISSRNEAKANIGTAWICYINIARYLQGSIPNHDEQRELLRLTVHPLFEHFIHPSQDPMWRLMGDSPAALAKAFHMCFMFESSDKSYQESDGSMGKKWDQLAAIVIRTIDVSSPAQSLEFQKSQQALIDEASRWFNLQAEILNYSGTENATDQNYKQTLMHASGSIIDGAMNALKTRKGEPFGAAITLEIALNIAPSMITESPPTMKAITDFLHGGLTEVLVSPSASALIKVLKKLWTFPDQVDTCMSIWEATIAGLLALPRSREKAKATEALISSRVASKMVRQNSKLQDLLIAANTEYLANGSEEWRWVGESGIKYDCFSDKTLDVIFYQLTDALNGPDGTFEYAVISLEYIAGRRPQIFERDDSRYGLIMAKLLSAGESRNAGMVTRAAMLRKAISDILNTNTGTSSTAKSSPIVTIIQESLDMTGPESLTVRTLVEQAVTIVGMLGLQPMADLFPNPRDWRSAMQQVMNGRLNFSLSLATTLHGAVALISTEKNSYIPPTSLKRDITGYSVGFRMALYTSELIKHKEVIEYLENDTQVEILHLMLLSVAMATDQFSLRMEGWLWESLADPIVEREIENFLTGSRKSLQSLVADGAYWRDSYAEGQSQVANKLLWRLIKGSYGNSAISFYSGRLLSSLLKRFAECHGFREAGADEWLASLDVFKPFTPNTFTAAAVLVGLKDHIGGSKVVNTFCNRLVSDVPGSYLRSDETLPGLVLLNAALDIYGPGKAPVAHNRLVFAVKHVCSWMDELGPFDPAMASECCRALRLMFPGMKDDYGSYWEMAIQFCLTLWSSEVVRKSSQEWLPAIHSSITLMTALRELEEPNEDLQEALDKSEKPISQGILHLLTLEKPEREDKPWQVVNELITKEAMKIPVEHIGDYYELFPLLAEDYPSIQTAAYSILHRVLAPAQEEISVNMLLEDKAARLPEELVSLLLHVPHVDDFSEESLSQLPPSVRTYLLAWHLVYDSFPTASHKVRGHYAEQLQDENLLYPLLDFLFDYLGHTAGSPLNLSRARITDEHIRSYDMAKAISMKDKQFELRWLLVNLWFLCLKYTPMLAKKWYVECKSKQTRVAVEQWTEKHFSPLVIADTLDDVEQWAEQQKEKSEQEGEQPLIIKVSKKSKEVFAGYEVDEMTMQIVVRIFPLYPLEGIKVDGLNRVAVTERKWQSWLITTQGVITFSNGSISDGLVAFRRNVTGALKGQTECAICYSIVSSDRRMPDKRCQTCKHLFHSGCLYKWFASSNQNTCPLCRNPFNYGVEAERRARRRQPGNSEA